MSSVGHYAAFDEPNIKMNEYAGEAKMAQDRAPSQVEQKQEDVTAACERLAKVVNSLESRLAPVMVGSFPTEEKPPSPECEELTQVSAHLSNTADNINHLVGCIHHLLDRTKL